MLSSSLSGLILYGYSIAFAVNRFMCVSLGSEVDVSFRMLFHGTEHLSKEGGVNEYMYMLAFCMVV